MKLKPVHYALGNCNQSEKRITTDKSKVTCKNCLRVLATDHKISPQLRYHRRHHTTCLQRQGDFYGKNRKKEIARVTGCHKQNPEACRRASSKYGFANRKKTAARLQAWRKVPLDDKCDCGTTENLQRHHPDYDKPLEVLTKCTECHGSLSRKEGD
jgi:hypothetical protein